MTGLPCWRDTGPCWSGSLPATTCPIRSGRYKPSWARRTPTRRRRRDRFRRPGGCGPPRRGLRPWRGRALADSPGCFLARGSAGAGRSPLRAPGYRRAARGGAGRDRRTRRRRGDRTLAAAGGHRGQARRAACCGRSAQTRTRSSWSPVAEEMPLRYHDWVAGRRAAGTRGHRRKGRLPARAGHDGAWLGTVASRPARRDVARGGGARRARQRRRSHVATGGGEAGPPTHRMGRTPRQASPHLPDGRPAGPMVTVTDENAGSDGDIVTAMIQERGLGPVVGMRSWGGVVGIGPATKLVDGSTVTQPRYAMWVVNRRWSVENHGVDPDVEVPVPPQAWAGPGSAAGHRGPDGSRGPRVAPAGRAPGQRHPPSRRRPPLPPRG